MHKFENIVFNIVNRIATLEKNNDINIISSNNEVMDEKEDTFGIINKTADSKILDDTINIPQLDGFGAGVLPANEINPCWDVDQMWYHCEKCSYHSSTASGLEKHKKKKHKM